MLHVSYKAISNVYISPFVGNRNEMIVVEAERRLKIKGFLMAGSSFLAPARYVLIFRYAFFV